MLNIKTKVLHANDFFNNIEEIGSDGEIIFEELIESLNNLKHNIDISNSISVDGVVIFRLINPYFDYFNEMQMVEDENQRTTFIFYKEYENYSNFSSYEELKIITNRIIRTLGRDLYNLKKYSANDTLQIKNGDWQGRFWDFELSDFFLEINKGRFTLNFQPK